MPDKFEVTVHGESGDMVLYGQVGYAEGYAPLETWDQAINRAWCALSTRGANWKRATVREVVMTGVAKVIRLDQADWIESHRIFSERFKAEAAAARDATDMVNLFDDES